MINRRGDAVRVLGGEAEAVVLLEILIGSHTAREEELICQQQPSSRTHKNPITEINTTTTRPLMWEMVRQSRSEGLFKAQLQLK